jgi:hypothetical protein
MAQVLNRAVLMLRYKQPFVDWINANEPNPQQRLKLSDANSDSTCYLIEVEEEEELEGWLKLNGAALFEAELHGWFPDQELWPKDRSRALFDKWCAYELHTLVFDTGTTPLLDSEEPDSDE